jgi:hypothetical protein
VPDQRYVVIAQAGWLANCPSWSDYFREVVPVEISLQIRFRLCKREMHAMAIHNLLELAQ